MIIKVLYPFLYHHLKKHMVEDMIVLINEELMKHYLKELPYCLPNHNPYFYIFNHNHRLCRDHRRLYKCECNVLRERIYRHQHAEVIKFNTV